MFALILFVLAASWGLDLADPFVRAWGVGFGVAAAVAIPVAAIWVAIVIVGAYSMRLHGVTAVRDMGYNICPICWYLLDGQPQEQSRCPECGKEKGTLGDNSEVVW